MTYALKYPFLCILPLTVFHRQRVPNSWKSTEDALFFGIFYWFPGKCQQEAATTGGNSGGSTLHSSQLLASFLCHYRSKMTLFSNPAKPDKYHQPVTSYISNSNITASKSFYISISFAGSSRQPLILPRYSNAAFAHRGYSQTEQQVISCSLSSSVAHVLGNLDPISPYLAQE